MLIYLPKNEEKVPVFMGYNFTSARPDMNWLEMQEVMLPYFDLVNIGGNYRFNKFNFNLRVDNIFNRDYMQIYGYTASPRNFRATIRYQF